MALSISDIRSKYPMYKDIPDNELADAFYNKFYTSIPKDQFYAAIGVPYIENPPKPEQKPDTAMSVAMATSNVAPENRSTLARGVIRGAALPVTLANDIVYGAGNYLTGQNLKSPMGSTALEEVLSRNGLTKPTRPSNKFLEEAIAGGVSGRMLGAGGGLPGAMSAGSAEVARQNGAGPVGQLGAALLGGASPFVVKSAVKSVPIAAKAVTSGAETIASGVKARSSDSLRESAGAIRQSAKELLDSAHNSGVALSSDAQKRLLTQLVDKAGIGNSAARADILSNTRKALAVAAEDLSKPGITLDKIHDIRRVTRDMSMASGSNPTDASKASDLVDVIDEFLDNLDSTKDFVSGAGNIGKDAIANLKAGMSRYKDYRNFEKVSDIIINSGGEKSKIVSGIKSILKSPKKRASFSPDQIDKLEKISKTTAGEIPLNLLGSFGIDVRKIADTGAIPLNNLVGAGSGTMIGAFGSGPIGVGLVGAGTLAKEGSRALKRGKIENLLRSIESMPVSK